MAATHKTAQGASSGTQRAGFLESLKDWHCLAFIVMLVALFFHNILLGQAYFWEDFLYQNYPFRNFAATSMAMGQLPLWNPYTFNGMPFLADIQTTVFYLPCTILALFVNDGRLHFYWLELVIILHYVLAGWSMFFLARSFAVGRLPALFAGVSYMLSGFMITHAIHQQMITLVAWYPLIFLLFRKVLAESHWKWVFLTALVLGHSILAGFPQLSLYLYFFLAAFFGVELLNAHTGKHLLSRPAVMMCTRAAAVVVISVGLAMIQLLPTFELSDLSQRAQITYEKASEGSLAWSQLVTLVFPKFFGTAGAEGYNYWGPGTYWYYWETCIYLGIATLMLLVLSLTLVKSNRQVRFLWGVVLFSILFALGDNFFLHKLFYDFVPGFSKFRNPARIGIFLSLAASLLSAFALQSFSTEKLPERISRGLRRMTVGILLAGIALTLLVATGTLPEMLGVARDPRVYAAIGENAYTILLIIGLVFLLVYAAIAGKLRPSFAASILVVLLFADMWVFGKSQNTSKTDPGTYFGRYAPVVRFLKEDARDEIFRVNSRNSGGLVLDRNHGMIERIFMMEGYTPLALQRAYAPLTDGNRSLDLLNVKYKTVTDMEQRTLRLTPHETYLPRAFFVYRYRIASTDDEVLAILNSPDFDHRTTAVIEKDPGVAQESADTMTAWRAVITEYSNNSITLDVETPTVGLLVLSEIHYPGWSAYVDSKATEVYRTNYNLRGIIVPRGVHSVQVKFEPESFSTGTSVTSAALLVCLGGLAAGKLRTGKRKT